MELDELRHAWHALGERLERQDVLQRRLLRDHATERARRGLRPLIWAQTLQVVLGIGLILLGVACWTRSAEVPALLATGVLVHVFGALTAGFAGVTLGLAGTIDYAAPVLRIQKQLSRLRWVYLLNVLLCGLPWWIMWLPVTVAFTVPGPVATGDGAPRWILASLVVSLVGWVATAAGVFLRYRRVRAGSGRGPLDEANAIRQARRLMEEVAEFERG